MCQEFGITVPPPFNITLQTSACKQALQLLKIICDTQWRSCLEMPYSLNTVFHMQKNVDFSHILCLTASPSNNNHTDWNQDIKEATNCKLFIACSNNTGPIILHTHICALSLSLSLSLSALMLCGGTAWMHWVFLTLIWYVGCISLCLMWTTSDPSKFKSSYFIFIQYSPCHSESFNGFLYKVILLGVVDTGYFLQDFLWLFF